MKKLIGLVGIVGLMISVGCAANICGSGQQNCGGTCISNLDQCCDPNAGTYCNAGTVCSVNNTCVSPVVNNAAAQCNSCLNEGLECCPNSYTDQVGCMGVGRICCFDGYSCPSGTSCLSNGTCS